MNYENKKFLKRAAKAIGLLITSEQDEYFCYTSIDGREVKWNPLTDNGDALSIATSLGFTLSWVKHHNFDYATAYNPINKMNYRCATDKEHDDMACIRLAIVLAAGMAK